MAYVPLKKDTRHTLFVPPNTSRPVPRRLEPHWFRRADFYGVLFPRDMDSTASSEPLFPCPAQRKHCKKLTSDVGTTGLTMWPVAQSWRNKWRHKRLGHEIGHIFVEYKAKRNPRCPPPRKPVLSVLPRFSHSSYMCIDINNSRTISVCAVLA